MTRIDRYECVLAVRNAWHPDSEQFLLDVLSNKTPSDSNDTRFCAAIGLAELGNPVGVEWLLEKANPADRDHDRDLFFAHKTGQHFYAQSGRLGENCLRSLEDLAELNPSDENDVETFINWWNANKEQFAGGRVKLLLEPGGSLN